LWKSDFVFNHSNKKHFLHIFSKKMVNINVKCSPRGQKITLDVDTELTVEEFKALVEEKSQIPAAEQRLIYKGHVLRDPRTLQSYSIEDQHTILLIRGRKGANADDQGTESVPTQSTTSSTPQSTGINAIPTSTTNADANANANANANPFGTGANPFAALMGNNANFGNDPMMGMMGMNPQMMQQMMNPQVISGMLQNPMVQQMMSEIAQNPQIIQEMIQGNPMLQGMVANNPMASAMLSNPQMLSQMMNPQTIQAALQMQQAMSQLQQSGIYDMFNPNAMNRNANTANTSDTSTSSSTSTTSSTGTTDVKDTTDKDTGESTSTATPNVSQTSTANPAPPNLAAMMQQMMSGMNQQAQPPQSQAQQPNWAALFGAPPQQANNQQPALNPFAFLARPPNTNTANTTSSTNANTSTSNTSSQPAVRPEILYHSQLAQLNDMGFTNPQANIQALIATGGNLEAAVNLLIAGL